jgi:4-amino-4-deoxy-L-arabinose transferase-like glycosyltransferase
MFPFFPLEIWGRLVSVISAMFSIFFVYLLGKRFLGEWGGVLSSFFFAFIPYNIYFTRVILPEPLATMLGLLALVLFVRFIDKDKFLWFYLSALIFSLAILVKPFVAFYVVPMIYLLLAKYGLRGILTDSKLLVKLFVFTDIVLVPFFIWRAWIFQFPEGIPFYTWMFNGDGIRFRPAFWRWIFSERLGKLILAVWGLPLFVIGTSWIKKGSYFVQFFLFGMLCYVAVVATANVRHDYYQIFAIPAISLACGAGALYLAEAKNLSKLIARGFLAFSVLMMLGAGFYQIKGNYNINHPEIVAAGKIVDRMTAKDALVIAPYNGDTAFLYQTKRWGWPAVDSDFNTLIKEGADYYVTVTPEDSDSIFIKSHFKVIKEEPGFMLADLHQPISALKK